MGALLRPVFQPLPGIALPLFQPPSQGVAIEAKKIAIHDLGFYERPRLALTVDCRVGEAGDGPALSLREKDRQAVPEVIGRFVGMEDGR